MSTSRLFYYSGGIDGPMVALVLLLLQLLLASSVGARPSGRTLLGGDPQECDTFIQQNAKQMCINEAKSQSNPGDGQSESICKFFYLCYKCETLAACKGCSSNSLAKWIQQEQQAVDDKSKDKECLDAHVPKPPPLVCPPTTTPTTILTTTTTTKLPTTTKAGFPLWIIGVVIVVVVAILGIAIAGYFFLCRKSKTPKPNKSSRRLGSSAPAVVSSTANEDADAGGAVPGGPSGAVAGPTGPAAGASVGRATNGPSGGPSAPVTGASVGRAANGPSGGPSAPVTGASVGRAPIVPSGGPSVGVGAAAGGRDTRESLGSRRKHKKSSRRRKGSKGSRRSKRESKKSLAKRASSKQPIKIPPKWLTKSGGRACPVMQKIRAQMRAEENEAKAKMQQAKAQGKQMPRPPTKCTKA